VVLRPVQQRQLELRHARAQLRIILALAHLLGHVLADSRDARVVLMLLVGDQQVQLGVLLDLDTQLVQALDRRIAGEEVLRTRTEGDDLEILEAQDGARDRHELRHHVRDLLCGAHRILRNIALEMAHTQVIGAVEHAAVRVAAAVDHVAVALGSRHEHARTVEVLRDQGLRGLRTEVAQEHGQRIAARFLDLSDGLEHILLVLNGGLGLVNRHLALAGGHDAGAALFGQHDREAVAGNRDDTQLDDRNVGHHGLFLLC